MKTSKLLIFGTEKHYEDQKSTQIMIWWADKVKIGNIGKKRVREFNGEGFEGNESG